MTSANPVTSLRISSVLNPHVVRATKREHLLLYTNCKSTSILTMPEILSLGAPEATSTKNKRIQYKLKQQQQPKTKTASACLKLLSN